jgi:hypothetical protein
MFKKTRYIALFIFCPSYGKILHFKGVNMHLSRQDVKLIENKAMHEQKCFNEANLYIAMLVENRLLRYVFQQQK